MGQTVSDREGKEKSGYRQLFVEIGARIGKSLFFWGMAAILAFSAYTDLVKLGDAVPIAAVGEDKRVALTFDDGPHPVYTKMLLEGLAERNVHASFFVIGKNISGREDLIAKMYEEGHLIGNHTFDHVKICDLSGEAACEQIEKTSALIREITGEDTEFVRPPFGEWNKSMECSFQMIPVMWDVDPLDWTTKNEALVRQRILDKVKAGDIILMHDCYESSVTAALEVVDQLLAEGYEFVTVEELILE